jgi:hypothetical protein
MTYPSGMGGQFVYAHHSGKALSGQMKNPCFGGGATAKAFDTSVPKISKFSAAETA